MQRWCYRPGLIQRRPGKRAKSLSNEQMHGAMLNGKRRQVGVGDQIHAQITVEQESFENVAVVGSGGRHPGLVGIEPVSDVAPCIHRGQWVCGHTGVGDDALERHQRCPR